MPDIFWKLKKLLETMKFSWGKARTCSLYVLDFFISDSNIAQLAAKILDKTGKVSFTYFTALNPFYGMESIMAFVSDKTKNTFNSVRMLRIHFVIVNGMFFIYSGSCAFLGINVFINWMWRHLRGRKSKHALISVSGNWKDAENCFG